MCSIELLYLIKCFPRCHFISLCFQSRFFVFSKQIFFFITMNMDMISVYCSSRNWCRPVSIHVLLQAVTDWLSNTDTLSVCFRNNENFSSQVFLVQIFYRDMKIIYFNPESSNHTCSRQHFFVCFRGNEAWHFM